MNMKTAETNNNYKGFGKTKLKITKTQKHLGPTMVHPYPIKSP